MGKKSGFSNLEL